MKYMPLTQDEVQVHTTALSQNWYKSISLESKPEGGKP